MGADCRRPEFRGCSNATTSQALELLDEGASGDAFRHLSRLHLFGGGQASACVSRCTRRGSRHVCGVGVLKVDGKDVGSQ
jgi:hypothetical protein